MNVKFDDNDGSELQAVKCYPDVLIAIIQRHLLKGLTSFSIKQKYIGAYIYTKT